MQFKLWINTDNEAFQSDGSDDTRNNEVARILREVADRVARGDIDSYYRTLFDVNGNDVGRAAFKED